mmetsp:Transcript_20119/g.29919  ORF Transcript_20119/g.29919 Transcript_20119/m.29919 type:complete len:234 (-) Transcript_20119:285-986(-)
MTTNPHLCEMLKAQQQLPKMIEKSRKTFDQWTQQQLKGFVDELDEHCQFMSNCQERLDALSREEQQVQQARTVHTHQLEDMQTTVSELDTALEQLRLQANTQHPQSLAKARAGLSQAQERLAKYQKHFEGKKSQYDRRSQQLLATLSAYRRHLGLEFVVQARCTTKIIFTQVDKDSPNREFYFIIAIDDNNQYELQACQPRVSGLKPYVDFLNETNDFGGFIRFMRKQFQLLC